MGKTALIEELQKRVRQNHVHFIRGSFGKGPLSGWVGALEELVDQIGAMNNTHVNNLLSKISKSLGNKHKRVFDALPRLNEILKIQRGATQTPYTKNKTNLEIALSLFFISFPTPKAVLVLFLDNLHLIDSGSLEVFNHIVNGRPNACLLIIGAYNENRMPLTHDLMKKIEPLKNKNFLISHLTLTCLKKKNLQDLLIDTLKCSKAESISLGEAIYAKTAGNAQSIHKVLQSIAEDGLLTIDPESKRWSWDLQSIKNLSVSENLVNHFLGKVNRLSRTTRSTLQLAAGLGIRFHPSHMLHISEYPQRGDPKKH